MARVHRHPRLLSFAVVLALGLAACGSDGATEATTPADEAPTGGDVVEDATDVPDNGDAATDEPGAEGVEGDSAAALGTVTVDGTEYAIDELRNCEPRDLGDGSERMLELQGIGSADGERVQVDVSVDEGGAGGSLHAVSWSGPEGVLGNQALELGGQWMDNSQTSLGAPPLELSDDVVRGEMPVLDAMTQSDGVLLTLELPVPADVIACR
jgi:hypothetical protein